MKPENIKEHIIFLNNTDYGTKPGANAKHGVIRGLVKNYFKALELHHYTNDNKEAEKEAERRMEKWWTSKQEGMHRHRSRTVGNKRIQGEEPAFYFRRKWQEYLESDMKKAELGRVVKNTLMAPARFLGLSKKETPMDERLSAQVGFNKNGEFTPYTRNTPIQITGGKNKRKVHSVNKRNVLGKQKKVYKFVGNKKKYIKCKNKYVLLKKYKEMQIKKTKVKKNKVKKTKK